MEKIIINLFAFLLIAVFSVSCKDDEDSNSIGFVGKWEAFTVVRSQCVEQTDNKSYECSPTVGTGVCYTLEFNAGNAFKITRTQGSDVIGAGTYTQTGAGYTLSFTTSNPYNLSDFYYIINVSGATLTTDEENGVIGCHVKSTYKRI